MTKGLFCYDGPLYTDINGDIFDVALSNKVLARYLTVVDRLELVIRTKFVGEGYRQRMSQITLPHVKITSVPNLSSLRGQVLQRRLSTRIIEERVANSDVVFCRLPSVIGAIAIKYARKYKKSYFVEVVGCPWDAFWNHSLTGKLVAPVMYYVTRNVVRNSPYALYVTDEFLQSRYPSGGRCISCSDVTLPPSDESVLLRRLTRIKNMDNDKPIVLGTIGAVNVPYKGQQYVIKAIERLNKDGLNFEYAIAGGGDNGYLQTVARKCGVLDKVKFLGSMPHDKIFDYLDTIDVYIQPSKLEGMPRSLIEAFSRGCPALASKTGGIPELLDESFMFNKGSVSDVSDLLRRVTPAMLMTQADRNFQKAKEYQEELLDARRTSFYNQFKESVVVGHD